MLAAKHFILTFLQQCAIVLMVVIVGWVILASMSGADAQTPAIVEQDTIQRDLAEVQRTYRGQLEEYRVAQQQFVVAQQESVQLGTLSSLESAVKATQKVMIIRDQVLLTYTKMLELELRLADGVELSLKNESLDLLEEISKALTRHLDNTRTSVDRQAMAARADDFEALEPLYSFGVDFARQLLLLGKLRNSYDTAAGIFNELASAQLSQGAIAKEERSRALEEIRLSLADVDYLLDQSELKMSESLSDAQIGSHDNLDDAYVAMIKIANFLDEVHIPSN